MSGGKKFDADKPDLSLLSSKALVEIAKVMTYGKNKYGAQNWRKGLEWSRVYAAVQRHLLAWNDGETHDPETGISHLAHASCGLLFLLDFAQTHPELDDRYYNDKGMVVFTKADSGITLDDIEKGRLYATKETKVSREPEVPPVQPEPEDGQTRGGSVSPMWRDSSKLV